VRWRDPLDLLQNSGFNLVRVLLDNCVPWRLGSHITGHAVESAVRVGWADLDDGPLLDAMAGKFDVLVTVDQSIPYQQQIKDRPLAVLVLKARSNKLADLVGLVPRLIEVLNTLRPGDVYVVS
jgi:hypothetical protein